MTISTPYALSDLTGLKGLTSVQRADNYSRLVILPGTDLPPSWYTFRASFPAVELGSVVVRPDDLSTSTVGRWIKAGPPLLYVASTRPNISPPLIGIIWQANLVSPTRTIYYQSFGTSATSDWKPFSNQVVGITQSPAVSGFIPDYVNELVYNPNNNQLFIAEGTGTVNDWVNFTGSTGGGS